MTGEVPEGGRGTLSKRFGSSASDPIGPPPPYDGGGVMSLSVLQQRHHLGEGVAGIGFEFGPGAVLVGVGAENDAGFEAQRIALRLDAVDEPQRDDLDAGQAPPASIIPAAPPP